MVEKQDTMVGRTLGPYEIERPLGSGGMGTVYLAHTPEGDPVALKVLHRELSGQEQLVERFLREAEAGKRLDHPTILRTLGRAGSQRGRHFFAMEYFVGETLEQLWENGGPLTERQVVVVAYYVAGALEYAHREGVFHRDIKPSNIMVNAQGEVRIADFGIARVQTASRLTETGTFLGTPAYCSPEQLRGKRLDGRADLYALGVTMYELLTGVWPYDGDTHFEIMESVLNGDYLSVRAHTRSVSRRLAKLIDGMVERDPDRRTACAADVMERLEVCIRKQVRTRPGAKKFEQKMLAVTQDLYTQGGGAPESDEPVVRTTGVSTLDVPASPKPRATGGQWFRRLTLAGAAASLAAGVAFDVPTRYGVPVLVRLMAVDQPHTIQVARAGLGVMGDAAVPGLLTALETARGEDRERLYAALSDLTSPAATDTLLAGLEDPDGGVRAHALRGLGALHHPDTASFSVRALRDPDPRVRVAAVRLAAEAREPAYLSPLAGAYVGADATLRNALTCTLQSYGASALPHLQRVWDGLDHQGRHAVVACVEGIGGPQAVDLLVSTMKAEERDAMRFLIGDALGRMTGERLGSDPAVWQAWRTRQGGVAS